MEKMWKLLLDKTYQFFVMKLGGKSIKNAEAMENIAQQLKHLKRVLNHRKCIIVVSAIEGVTRNLAEIFNLSRGQEEGRTEKMHALIKDFTDRHEEIINELFPSEEPPFTHADVINAPFKKKAIDGLLRLMDQIQLCIIHPHSENDGKDDERNYSQIVHVGEMASSMLLNLLLEKHDANNIKNHLLLESTIFMITKNEDIYRNASIDENATQEKMEEFFLPHFNEHQFTIIQGFIASNPVYGFKATMPLDGSDSTAALLAKIMKKIKNQQGLVLYVKDTPGVIVEDKIVSRISHTDLLKLKPVENRTVIHTTATQTLLESKTPAVILSYEDFGTDSFTFVSNN